jgi:hypothetical protein
MSCPLDANIIKDKVDWDTIAKRTTPQFYISSLQCLLQKKWTRVPMSSSSSGKPRFKSWSLPDLMDEIKYLLQCEKKGFFLHSVKGLHEPSTMYQYTILNQNLDVYVTTFYIQLIEKRNPAYVRDALALRQRYYRWFIKPVTTINELIYFILNILYQSSIHTTSQLEQFLGDFKVLQFDPYREFVDFVGKKLQTFMHMQYHHYINTIVYEIYHFDRFAALKDIAKKYIQYVADHRDDYYKEIAALLKRYRIDPNDMERFRFEIMDFSTCPIYTEDVHNRVIKMRKEMRLPAMPSPLYKSSRIPRRRISVKRKIAKKRSSR